MVKQRVLWQTAEIMQTLVFPLKPGSGLEFAREPTSHAQCQATCKTSQFKRNRTKILTLHSTAPPRYSWHAQNPQPRLFQPGYLLTLHEPDRDTPERFQRRLHDMAIIGRASGECNYYVDITMWKMAAPSRTCRRPICGIYPLIYPCFLKVTVQQHNPSPATLVCVSITCIYKGTGLRSYAMTTNASERLLLDGKDITNKQKMVEPDIFSITAKCLATSF